MIADWSKLRKLIEPHKILWKKHVSKKYTEEACAMECQAVAKEMGFTHGGGHLLLFCLVFFPSFFFFLVCALLFVLLPACMQTLEYCAIW